MGFDTLFQIPERAEREVGIPDPVLPQSPEKLELFEMILENIDDEGGR